MGNAEMALEQNNLSLLNYKFKLSATPNIEYRVQTLQLPGMDLGEAVMPTPFVRITNPGNITYGDLSVTFLVGEEMKDYLEIYSWMVKLGHPDSYDQYTGERYDASVLILSSAMRPIINVRFTDIYPSSISSIDFDTTLAEVQYATATATFRFNRMYYDAI